MNSLFNEHPALKDIKIIELDAQNDIINKPAQTEEEDAPTEEKMPCFKVYDEEFGMIGEKHPAGVYQLSKKFSQTKNAVEIVHKWICSPLKIIAVSSDENGENVGRLLCFKNISGEWKEWVMPMELLKSSGDEVRGSLLSMGVDIDTKSGKNLFLEYLRTMPDKRITTVKSIGWHEGCFILPDRVIGENPNNARFHCNYEAKPEFGVKGSLEGWKENIAKYAIGNTKLALSISAALAGALIHPLKKENGGFHIFGHSSTGKTTTLAAASSVWGCPNYKRTWRATSNGLEGIAALTNDGFLALDEISQCDPNQLSDVAYLLGNGSTKIRANRYGSARGTLSFRLIFLSTGEESLDAAIEKNGTKSKAGQAIRFLSIPVNEAHGIWDNLHDFSSGAELSMHINETVKENYGHAGIIFLEKLIAAKNIDLIDRFKKITNRFPTSSASGQEGRAIERFALTALAGELATEFEITGWNTEMATQAALAEYKKWREHRGCGNSEEAAILKLIYDYLQRNGETLFSWAEPTEGYLSQIPKRAGWHDGSHKSTEKDIVSDRETITTFYFISSVFKEVLKGYDTKIACKILMKYKVLDHDTGRNQKSMRITGHSGITRVYAIRYIQLGKKIEEFD